MRIHFRQVKCICNGGSVLATKVCHQSNLIDKMSFSSQWHFASFRQSGSDITSVIAAKSPFFPTSQLQLSHNSLQNSPTGELARRLRSCHQSTHQLLIQVHRLLNGLELEPLLFQLIQAEEIIQFCLTL